MKKSTTFGLLATVALALSPLSAFAQTVSTQGNYQGGVQSNVTQGYGNVSQQLGSLNSTQSQVNLNGSGLPSVAGQLSQQQILQESAVLGEYNQGLQVGEFYNGQSQVNINPHVPQYQYQPVQPYIGQ